MQVISISSTNVNQNGHGLLTRVKQSEKIDIISYHDYLTSQQFQKRSNATSSSTRQSASTRHKGKEVAKPITPQSESVSEEDIDPEQAQRDKEMQNNLALLVKYFKKLYKPTNNNLRTSSNSKNKTKDTTPRFLLHAWDNFIEVKHAQPEEVQELLSKLVQDMKIISDELSEYINTPAWNRPLVYCDDDDGQ
ncbi:hypothetical protein Tco_0247699 [Tanacetum coccineum]